MRITDIKQHFVLKLVYCRHKLVLAYYIQLSNIWSLIWPSTSFLNILCNLAKWLFSYSAYFLSLLFPIFFSVFSLAHRLFFILFFSFISVFFFSFFVSYYVYFFLFLK